MAKLKLAIFFLLIFRVNSFFSIENMLKAMRMKFDSLIYAMNRSKIDENIRCILKNNRIVELLM